MTPDQYTALLNEVIESNSLARKHVHELAMIRGSITKLEGAVTGLQGDVIILGAKVDVNAEDIAKLDATVRAMMQTFDGMNHLAKSAYDMASANVNSIRGLERYIGKPQIDEQEPTAGDAAGTGGAAE